MELFTIKQIFGILLVVTGIFDAVKYSLQAIKIKKKRSADTMSRKFVLMAIGNDLVKIVYSILILDIYIFVSSILALACMFHLWGMVYIYYPYRKRNQACFKRPNLLLFTWNACIPNKMRKHL
jgi:uncharacterized protein with PQ loop repeat